MLTYIMFFVSCVLLPYSMSFVCNYGSIFLYGHIYSATDLMIVLQGIKWNVNEIITILNSPLHRIMHWIYMNSLLCQQFLCCSRSYTSKPYHIVDSCSACQHICLYINIYIHFILIYSVVTEKNDIIVEKKHEILEFWDIYL